MAYIQPSHQWIVGICSVVFDIDVGQRVEYLVPEGCVSVEEQHDVAFHSFPDSMSMELHARTSIKDSTFFFRIRRRGIPAVSKLVPSGGEGASGGDGGADGVDRDGGGEAGGGKDADGRAAGATGSERTPDRGDRVKGEQRSGDPEEERFLYGFVFCRQRQDASLRRGGEQMSVVVLAEHPLSAVLLLLSAVAGHQYFGSPGRAPLQQVYDEVCRWTAPVAGPQLQLPVGFTSLTARLPAWNTLPHPSNVTAAEQYGNNTLPHLRSPSARSMLPLAASAASSRRTLTMASDGDGLPPAALPSTGSGMPGLSPASSNASGLMLSPGSGPLGSALSGAMAVAAAAPTGVAAALALAVASPFSTSAGGGGGGVQQQQLDVAPPPQQQLERRRGSSGDVSPPWGRLTYSGPGGRLGTFAGGEPSLSSSAFAFGAAAAAAQPSGNGNAAGMVPNPPSSSSAGEAGGGVGGGYSNHSSSSNGYGSGGGPLPLGLGSGAGGGVPAAGAGAASAEGSLRQISSLLADGCAPTTVPVYPATLPPQPAHQRSRSSVLVPSRASSYAGASDDVSVLPPGGAGMPGSNGGSRAGPGQQHDAAAGEDAPAGAPRPLSVAWRRVPSNHQLGPADGAIHGAFHEVDVYTPLSGHLPRLWQLWEMTLLGRALLLVAPTPGETSSGVAALVSLIAPLPYAPDFRPYYCIHDTAFGRMASGVLPGPEVRDVPTLLGITNLYFIRALPHWPNVLSIGKRETPVAAVQPSGALAASMARANAAVQALRQRTQGASVLMASHIEALWSSYKPLCRPDQQLLTKLMQPKAGDVKSKVARMAFVNSDLIRRHFAELTASFLQPFNRYFEPGPSADGRVPGWNSEEFLFGLRSGALPLPQPLLDRVGSSAAAVELYARFTSSLNFAAWFASRRRHVAHLITPGLLGLGRLVDAANDAKGQGVKGQGQEAGAGGHDADSGSSGAGGAAAAGPGPRGADAGGAGGAGAARLGTRPQGQAHAGETAEEESSIASWFAGAAQHLDEVKLIGLFFSVEQQLMEAQGEAAAPDAPEEAAASVSRLQREMVLLFFGGRMPEELQLTCVSSPARRELLASLPLNGAQEARLQQLMDMLQVGGK